MKEKSKAAAKKAPAKKTVKPKAATKKPVTKIPFKQFTRSLMEEKLLNPQEVCAKFEICQRTLYTYCIKGLLPCYKMGTRIHFVESEITEAFRDSRLQ